MANPYEKGGCEVERVTRIELAFSAWEADVLPLNYTRGVDAPEAVGVSKDSGCAAVGPRHLPPTRRGPRAPGPLRSEADPAEQRRRPARPMVPRLPEPSVRLHRPVAGAGVPHRARRDQRRRPVRPASGRVRAGRDA